MTPRTHALLERLLAQPRAAVMGVLNVTPDSFSDGGAYLATEAALAQARRMIADGADILDIGAESTRPYTGATPVDANEEMSRLRDILPRVVGLGQPVSIDTMKARVAAWALGEGAAVVNDVWGLQRDADMARVVAEYGAAVVVMHNREAPDVALDIVADILAFFSRSLEIAERAGIAQGHIVLDPGIGFGKTPQQSLTALARLDEFACFGLPILVGASRKRFIDSVSPSKPTERLGGSLAAHLAAVQNGARIVRAHDVAETVQALRVAQAIEGAT
jgi:dihydropteroate synthase